MVIEQFRPHDKPIIATAFSEDDIVINMVMDYGTKNDTTKHLEMVKTVALMNKSTVRIDIHVLNEHNTFDKIDSIMAV